ncbi:hypothetical protein [Spirulina sp. 06S082]|nr:hypothetical protein [Spirulina sp. 06S082]MEA5471909.1 hypothetical protein [Spirulina sp. 06S082]
MVALYPFLSRSRFVIFLFHRLGNWIPTPNERADREQLENVKVALASSVR